MDSCTTTTTTTTTTATATAAAAEGLLARVQPVSQVTIKSEAPSSSSAESNCTSSVTGLGSASCTSSASGADSTSTVSIAANRPTEDSAATAGDATATATDAPGVQRFQPFSLAAAVTAKAGKGLNGGVNGLNGLNGLSGLNGHGGPRGSKRKWGGQRHETTNGIKREGDDHEENDSDDGDDDDDEQQGPLNGTYRKLGAAAAASGANGSVVGGAAPAAGLGVRTSGAARGTTAGGAAAAGGTPPSTVVTATQAAHLVQTPTPVRRALGMGTSPLVGQLQSPVVRLSVHRRDNPHLRTADGRDDTPLCSSAASQLQEAQWKLRLDAKHTAAATAANRNSRPFARPNRQGSPTLCTCSLLTTARRKRFRTSASSTETQTMTGSLCPSCRGLLPLFTPKQEPAASKLRPALIVSLYAHGWSMCFPHSYGYDASVEEVHPYTAEAEEFFFHLDMQAIPPTILEFLDKTANGLFHRGSVPTQVRDYRPEGLAYGDRQHRGDLMPTVNHLLLRPNQRTIVEDIHALKQQTKRGRERGFTLREWIGLERRILSALRMPVCTEPYTDVFYLASINYYNQTKMRLFRHNTPHPPSEFNDGSDEELDGEGRIMDNHPLVSFLARTRNSSEAPEVLPPVKERVAQEVDSGWTLAERFTQGTPADIAAALAAVPVLPTMNTLPTIPADVRCRTVVLQPDSSRLTTGSLAAVASHEGRRDEGAGGTYGANLVEMRRREVKDMTDNALDPADPVDAWDVCVRGPDDKEFEPSLSYAFESQELADGFCDQFAHVCRIMEGRKLVSEAKVDASGSSLPVPVTPRAPPSRPLNPPSTAPGRPSVPTFESTLVDSFVLGERQRVQNYSYSQTYGRVSSGYGGSSYYASQPVRKQPQAQTYAQPGRDGSAYTYAGRSRYVTAQSSQKSPQPQQQQPQPYANTASYTQQQQQQRQAQVYTTSQQATSGTYYQQPQQQTPCTGPCCRPQGTVQGSSSQPNPM
eukprot:m.460072 g.460072  ORF g.460072 m.460072 type:complete len:982 (+) comp20342_c6_seq23:1151-4096(+)